MREKAEGRGGEADEGVGLFRSEWWVLGWGWVGYPGIPFRWWSGLGWGWGDLVHCAPPP